MIKTSCRDSVLQLMRHIWHLAPSVSVAMPKPDNYSKPAAQIVIEFRRPPKSSSADGSGIV
jgi:hypothetical protein